MRRTAKALLLSLIICLTSSCASTPAPVLVTPRIELPAKPAMLPVAWTHREGQHCLTDGEARKLLINIARKDAHIEILEGVIQAIGGR